MVKAIENQTRHNTKDEIQNRKLAEEAAWVGDEQLANPPNWLISKVAKEEWLRLIEQFNKNSMISNLDYNNLGTYCNTFSLYEDLSRELKSELELSSDSYDRLTISKEYEPLLNKYSVLLLRQATPLGLTIQSRVQGGTNIVKGDNDGLGEEFGI